MVYTYDWRDVRDALYDELYGCFNKAPSDDDVNDCEDYVFGILHDAFYAAVKEFVDREYERWEEDEDDELP